MFSLGVFSQSVFIAGVFRQTDVLASVAEGCSVWQLHLHKAAAGSREKPFPIGCCDRKMMFLCLSLNQNIIFQLSYPQTSKESSRRLWLFSGLQLGGNSNKPEVTRC